MPNTNNTGYSEFQSDPMWQIRVERADGNNRATVAPADPSQIDGMWGGSRWHECVEREIRNTEDALRTAPQPIAPWPDRAEAADDGPFATYSIPDYSTLFSNARSGDTENMPGAVYREFRGGEENPPTPRPNTRFCDMCSIRHPESELSTHEVNGRGRTTICRSCATSYVFECSECRVNRVCYSTFLNPETQGRMCDECMERWQTCNNCGRMIRRLNEGERREYLTCSECRRGLVLDYNAHAVTIPVGAGKIHFGVELEVEARGLVSSKVETIQDRMSDPDFAIIKHDGSLENGFEIVTRPASLAVHAKEWGSILSSRIVGLRSERTETCGMHVHCSRRPMSELQVAKIVCFTNANANRQFVQLLAGRISDRWSRLENKKLSDGNKANEARYEAVNLQNRETIEFRIFRGTLNYVSLMKNIEFCEALCMFSYPANIPLQQAMSLDAFITFIHKERRFSKKLGKNILRWPHLVAFVDAKWLGVETKLTRDFGLSVTSHKSVPPTT